MSTPNPLVGGGGEPMTKKELREVRRLKAKKYREMYLLPRFVNEEGGKRKLEAGEFDENSSLYPLSTPIEQLSDFGIGITMYFTTSFWFGLMLLVCAFLQTPMASFFNSEAYDKFNSQDSRGFSGFKTIGSASCLDEVRVCLNQDCTSYAGEFHFPQDAIPRYGNYDTSAGVWRDSSYEIYDDEAHKPNWPTEHGLKIGTALTEIIQNEDKLTVGKRQCQVRRWFGIMDLTMMVFISAVLGALAVKQNREAEEIDLMEQTAQDYSVVIEDPNPDSLDPDEWKEFFEERFGPVFMVTVCLNNGKLLKLFRSKRRIENEMKLEAIEEARYAKARRRASDVDEGFLAQLTMNQSAKSYFKQLMEMLGLDPTLEYFTMQLLKVNMQISKLKHKTYHATKVFVIFNEEQSQRRCLESMCVGVIPAMMDRTDEIDPKFLFKGNLLAIREAPEPSSVLYENLEVGAVELLKQQVVSWFVLGLGMVVTYFTIDASFQNGLPFLGALLISFWNSVLPMINKFLVASFETHHDLEGVENSFIQKTVAARGFTSSLILYLVGLSHSPQVLSPYYIGSIQAVLLADALTTPIVRAMDIGGFINQNILAPIAGTDDRAKALTTGTDYLLAERYTDLAKTVLMSMFFSAIFPVGFYYSAFACFCSFWADKYCVLRVFRQKPPTGDKLVRITRLFAALIVLVHAVVTCHYYFSWPFDNLCKTSTTLSTTGTANAALLNADASFMYEQCNSVSQEFLPFPQREAWFQEKIAGGTFDAQYQLVLFYYVVAIIMVVYIAFTYLGSDTYGSIYRLFWYKFEGGSETFDIRYESVASGEGFVPQVSVVGMNQTVLCCTAEVQGRPGGLPFQTYLLNWTAAKERTGDEAKGEEFTDLTDEEKDAVYRKACIYFDDQLEGVDQTNKDTRLLARAKQYIFNHATQEEGDFRMSTAGRARANTLKKEAKKAGGVAKLQGSLADQGMQMSASAQATAVKISGAVLAAPSAPSSNATWQQQQQAAAAAAAAGAADMNDAVFAKPAGDAALEAMAGGEDERRGTVSDNLDFGGVYK